MLKGAFPVPRNPQRSSPSPRRVPLLSPSPLAPASLVGPAGPAASPASPTPAFRRRALMLAALRATPCLGAHRRRLLLQRHLRTTQHHPTRHFPWLWDRVGRSPRCWVASLLPFCESYEEK